MNNTDLKQIEVLLDKKLNPIKKTLEEHSTKLDSLTLDMVDVQKKTDVIADIHSLIGDVKEKVNDHEERISQLEPSQKF